MKFEKALAIDNKEVSEIDLMVAKDDIFRESRSKQKMNRARRRSQTAAKKCRLGRQWKYADEEITAYWTEKDGDNKITHWVGDPEELKKLSTEEYTKYWRDIPWHKVKGINPENCGYSEYRRWGKSKELAKQRANNKKICCEVEPEQSIIMSEFLEVLDEVDMRESNKVWGSYRQYSLRFVRYEDGDVCIDRDGFRGVFNKLYMNSEVCYMLTKVKEAIAHREERIEEINRLKHALLLEYAGKIEVLNEELRQLTGF